MINKMNNHLSPHIIENKKDHDIWLWKARPWLGQAQICKARPWLGQAQICGWIKMVKGIPIPLIL
jgi:hypothetical protein